MKSKLLLTIIGLSLILGTNVPSFASSVLLQWDPNSEPETKYKVYYKADSPALPFDGVSAIEGAAPLDVQNLTTATVSGLAPGRTYYFAVTAYNTAGQESSYSNIVAETIPLSDTTAPTIVSFTIPATSTSLTVPITTFSGSDNVGVSGYLLTASAAAIPSASDNAGWTATPPTSYTFSSDGSKSLYAWAKDTAGNISNASGRTVIITLSDTIAPSVSAATIPTTSSTTTVPITTATSQSGYTIADALQALRISVGLITATKSQFNRLDVAPLFNGKPTPDGKININDALMILSKTVGLTSW